MKKLLLMPLLATAISMHGMYLGESKLPICITNKTNPQPNITIYEGILAQNDWGGKLTCEVTYNAKNKVYHSAVYNHHYSRSEWFSEETSGPEAKEYFDAFVAKEAAQQ